MMIDMDDPDAPAAAQARQPGLHPAAGAATRSRPSAPSCDEIVDAVCERGECDFVCDIAAPLPLIMIGDALGVAPGRPRRAAAVVRRHAVAARAAPPPRRPSTRPPRPTTSTRDVRHRRDRRGAAQAPTDDLMSVLVHAEVDGDRLDDDALIFESLLILIGGDETTRHVISGGMDAAAGDPAPGSACAADRVARPRRGRGDAALGQPDQEHGPHRHPGRRVPRRSGWRRAEAAAALPVGQPRRGGVRRPVHLRHRPRTPNDARGLRLRHALLPRAARWPGSSCG